MMRVVSSVTSRAIHGVIQAELSKYGTASPALLNTRTRSSNVAKSCKSEGSRKDMLKGRPLMQLLYKYRKMSAEVEN